MAVKPQLRKAEAGGGAYFKAPSTSHQFISSGCALLDCALGGGYPLGRIVNVVGDKSTGKTLLAIEACANLVAEYDNARIWYLEAESAFDAGYAKALGFPVDKVKFVRGKQTVEDLFMHLEKVIDSDNRAPGLYIVDSLDALSDTAELARGIDKGTFGAAKAKQMSQLFRRLVRKLNEANICLFIISQVRDAIGVRFGVKSARTGGRAMDFYASQVMYLAQVGSIKKTIKKVERKIGLEIRAKITKNKIGLPLREADFNILFGFGVDDIAANIEWLKSVDHASSELARRGMNIDGMSDAEITEYRKELAAEVTRVWYEVESTFLPKRKKYGR